jgi:hypothetical protein
MESTLTTTTTEVRAQEQHQQKQQQKQFDLDLDTRNKIAAEIQTLLNREQQQQPQQQQQPSSGSKSKFIKFSDGQKRRLSFQDFEKKQVQNKDFATGELIPDSYSTRYFFSCYDITDPDHPSELSIFERGLREAKTILFWLSKNYNVLDVERHGKAGDKLTTYNIYPAIVSPSPDLERSDR